jgi:hypothetical protein
MSPLGCPESTHCTEIPLTPVPRVVPRQFARTWCIWSLSVATCCPGRRGSCVGDLATTSQNTFSRADVRAHTCPTLIKRMIAPKSSRTTKTPIGRVYSRASGIALLASPGLPFVEVTMTASLRQHASASAAGSAHEVILRSPLPLMKNIPWHVESEAATIQR